MRKMSEEARREVRQMARDFATAMHAEDDGEVLAVVDGLTTWIFGDNQTPPEDASDCEVENIPVPPRTPVTVTIRRRKA